MRVTAMEKDNSSIEAASEGNTTNEASESNKFEMPCRLRVVDVLKSDELKDLSPDMEIPIETRKKWVEDIQKAFGTGSDALRNIRPWDILLHLDGPATTIKYTLPDPIIEDTVVEKVYPVRYQLPSNALAKLPATKRVLQTERFALGCLIYEIHTQSKPYADLDDDVVRKLYNEGKFPSDDSSFLQKAAEYIRAHPIAFGLQVAGGAVAATSLLGLPILGALGFTAMGPAAGSAAAAWQASLGLVEAGSLFAFCQGAAMGGAAAGTIAGAGAAGAGVAGAATVATIPGWKEKVTGAFKFASDTVRGSGGKEGSHSDESQKDDSDGKTKL